MIHVRSFLRTPSGEFLPFDEAVDPIEDPDFAEGAIVIQVDDVEILGKEAWDYIAQLWCYIASAIDELRTKEEAGTYLPDQPIRLDFRRNGTDIALSSTINDYERTVTVPADELLMAIKHSGAAFFRKIQELSPSSSSSFDRYLSSLLS